MNTGSGSRHPESGTGNTGDSNPRAFTNVAGIAGTHVLHRCLSHFRTNIAVAEEPLFLSEVSQSKEKSRFTIRYRRKIVSLSQRYPRAFQISRLHTRLLTSFHQDCPYSYQTTRRPGKPFYIPSECSARNAGIYWNILCSLEDSRAFLIVIQL